MLHGLRPGNLHAAQHTLPLGKVRIQPIQSLDMHGLFINESSKIEFIE